jgi:hypothetical protein
MKLVVTGGRDYQLTAVDLAFLDQITRDRQIDELIHGDATGADAGAKAWAQARMIPDRPVPAKWKLFGLAAGPRRNTEMAEMAKAEGGILAAFPGNRGTNDMIEKATRRGIEVLPSPTRRAGVAR